jgi:hypothetical protein
MKSPSPKATTGSSNHGLAIGFTVTALKNVGLPRRQILPPGHSPPLPSNSSTPRTNDLQRLKAQKHFSFSRRML